MKVFTIILVVLVIGGLFGVGSYNSIQNQDEGVKASWSEVLNQYQRRADLVPNLVNTVKGYAAHESEVFQEVAKARAAVGSLQVSATDPDSIAAFKKAQGELSSAISRLLVVSENYPLLKADSLFRDLQAQLEGTENRTTVARNRYIKAVKEYNIIIRSFPSNIVASLFGYSPKASFVVEDEAAISKSPKVSF